MIDAHRIDVAGTRQPVVVVGGGVVGLCVAFALVRRRVPVTVVDLTGDGRPASWGNAGWVVPALTAPVPAPGVIRQGVRAVLDRSSPLRITPDPRLAGWLWSLARHCTTAAYRSGWTATLQLAARAREGFDELADSGVEFDMWSSGLTVAALRRAAAEAELERLRPLAAYGYRLPERIVSGDALRELVPALSDAVSAGFHIDQERHVDPGSLLAGLRRWLAGQGVELRVGEPVTRCVVERGEIRGVVVGGAVLPAAALVIAAGAWSGDLAAQLGFPIPLQGGKGYSFSAAGAPPVSRPLKLLERRVAITPLGMATRAAGMMEFDGLRTRARRGRLAAIRADARRYLRGWDGVVTAEPWAGLRPMTPDGLPVIGRIPTTVNGYLATGHAMLGITLGPVTGDLLAEQIVTGHAAPVLRPFSPERFRRTGRSR